MSNPVRVFRRKPCKRCGNNQREHGSAYCLTCQKAIESETEARLAVVGQEAKYTAACWIDSDDYPDGPQFAEDCANARLIAAAPDMYEALKARIKADAHPGMCNLCQPENRCREYYIESGNANIKMSKALQKAEGKSE